MPNVIVCVCPKCRTMHDHIPWYCFIGCRVVPEEDRGGGKPTSEMDKKPRRASAVGPSEDTPGRDSIDPMLTQKELAVYAEERRRAEETGEDLGQWERLRRRWAPRPQDGTPHLADLYRAYEEATGTRIGCD